MKKIYFILTLVALGLIQFTSSCKKDLSFSSDHLTFSVDTLLFDTVFTTVGTTTKRFKVYNKANKPLKIDHAFLAGGKNSVYRLNFDGEKDHSFSNITIPAKDSLFMFVEATLGENGINDPFIIMDSILFSTNGKEQNVKLAAWGQDAYFYNNDYVSGDWYDDKPHVIYNVALVDTNTSLTIHEGTRIYLHKNAMLVVDNGELHIEGTPENPVTFQGDRLEPFYDDTKGQYYGIYLQDALESEVNHAILKNGTAGIHITGNNSNNADYTVKIKNTEIYNMASYGIFNYQGGKVYGENLNIHNNNIYGFFQLEGGSYHFKHSQFLSYGADGNKPAIAIKNYLTHEDGFTYIGDIEEGTIHNSIVYGPSDIQVAYDTLTDNGSVSIHYLYNRNLIKHQPNPYNDNDLEGLDENPNFTEIIWNMNPKFENISDRIFKITSSSPCKDAGDGNHTVTEDIEGNLRSDGLPDIGAYEIE